MFKATTSIIPIQRSKFSYKLKSPSYSWGSLAKASLVFVITTGAFLALKKRDMIYVDRNKITKVLDPLMKYLLTKGK